MVDKKEEKIVTFSSHVKLPLSEALAKRVKKDLEEAKEKKETDDGET